jgi:hypothetical protein
MSAGARAWTNRAVFVLAVAAAAIVRAQAPVGLPVTTARPIARELRAAAPSDLPALDASDAAALWSRWLSQRDTAIRARLAEGDEDTVVNWVLLGTSFTSQPPVRLETVNGADDRALDRVISVIVARVEDVMRALVAPGADERRLFARRLLESRGQRFTTPPELLAARDYLVRSIQRVMRGSSAPGRGASATGAPTSEFERRGLSLDTSLGPNFAVHESLAALKAKKLLAPGAVQRVAIIGAGLDFADKNSGFDFYPVQTVQPFAVLDSLRTLALTAAGRPLSLVSLDISPRVLTHIAGLRTASGYTVRLPLARSRPWLPALRSYWKSFGGQIGLPAAAPVPPALAKEVELRAVQIAPASLAPMSAENVNVIVQRPSGAPFDLVIATNVLLYYGAFEQALALANIEAMLRPGGLLLSNTTLPELTGDRMTRVGAQRTLYTAEGEGDEIIWYQRRADAAPGR